MEDQDNWNLLLADVRESVTSEEDDLEVAMDLFPEYFTINLPRSSGIGIEDCDDEE